MLDKKTKNALIGAMRRVWHSCPQRISFLKLHEIREYHVNKAGEVTDAVRVYYRCMSCGVHCKTKGNDKYPKLEIDHIDPVMPLSGEPLTLDEIAKRIFVDHKALAIMCQTCHKLKTLEENRIRRANKKELQNESDPED